MAIAHSWQLGARGRAWACGALLAAGMTGAYAGAPPPVPPAGNSAWVYDALYQDGRRSGSSPGSFAAALNRYNHRARPGSAITRVFVYGGTLEMYCRGGGATCRPEDLKVSFGATGHQSIAAYARELEPVDGRPVRVVAILDGAIRANYAGSLKGFNQLSPEMAERFADEVAREICGDADISGVQFDLEPFDVRTRNGQYYFYRRIAEDFSGMSDGSGQGTFGCRDSAHPAGRYFSVFGSPHSLSARGAAGQNLREILTARHNGFFIGALYDLSDEPAGHRVTPDRYRRKVLTLARAAARGATQWGIPYQLAIPASASAHEYAGCKGRSCGFDVTTDGLQFDYLEAAVDAIKAGDSAANPLYLGAAVWAWSRAIVADGMQFSPAQPTAHDQEYLGDNL